jgi:hypothetical protein
LIIQAKKGAPKRGFKKSMMAKDAIINILE